MALAFSYFMQISLSGINHKHCFTSTRHFTRAQKKPMFISDSFLLYGQTLQCNLQAPDVSTSKGPHSKSIAAHEIKASLASEMKSQSHIGVEGVF